MKVLLFCLVLLLTASAPAWAASVPSGALFWSKAAVSDHSEAVEHVTVRANGPGGLATFLRIALANAGFQKGELKIQFRQESSGGTLYREAKFPRGQYYVMPDHLGVRAGKHTVEVKDGRLVASLDFGDLQAELTLASQAGGLVLEDRTGAGFVRRELMVPLGRLQVAAKDAARAVDHSATAFAVHEASTAPATRVYDRSLQVHHLHGGGSLIIDYVILPSERGARPFGFVVASGKGKIFVGEVVKEARTDEKHDATIGYKVPWQVTLVGKRGEARTAVRLVAEKQSGREDDLADLSFVVRKAVGAVFHPVTYTLKGTATIEVQLTSAEPPVAFDAKVSYRYAQTR
jgi:hypothetical protein